MFLNTKYNNLISYFEENKDKNWKEWLDFDKILQKPGKQGIVGLFNLKSNDQKYLFKMSQGLNYLVNHELVIMQGLSELSNYCPHFCKGIGIIKCMHLQR